MTLYLVHTGYYDKSFGDGFYEQSKNIFIVAETPYDIKVVQNENDHKINIYNHYQMRFSKSEK
jgi:hypothetical protein